VTGSASDSDLHVRSQGVGDWLDALASDAPAPGGGAAAAVNLAVGAALVSMVCNLTIGKPRYAEHEATMKEVLDLAESQRAAAVDLAHEDASAFAGVSAAYRLPKDSDEQKAARTAAVQEALGAAADVPLATVAAAVQVIELAGRILDGANVNVLSDVAVAASSARSALQSARINVEVNLGSMTDQARRDALQARLDVHRVGDAEKKADEIVAAVRRRILR
jgi:formiminotetrahydrofolate cyclodeaminase